METVARPLYAQVRDALIRRIADGHWKAGDSLPSEFALAAELGVSQGTVRKALNEMAAENLLDRRQGRGTFVPEHTEERSLFHFFRMEAADGSAVVPQPLSQTIEAVAPEAEISRPLDTGRRKLWRIRRVRGVEGRPAILETIHLDPRRFPTLKPDTVLPNALYGYYQSASGITVARADDRLTAVAAGPADAAALDLRPGAPLLRAWRLAYDLTGRVAEVRETLFDTSLQGYVVRLR